MNYSNSINNLYTIITQSNKTKHLDEKEKDNNKEGKDKRKVGYLSSRIIKLLLNFSAILKTCDGRDKLCAFIQYTSKFHATILYHSIDMESCENVEVEE
jgi:hypothetical protein